MKESLFYSLNMTASSSIQRPRVNRKPLLPLSSCYWLVSQVRAGNWLTQWQRSHLSHHWQQTALSSSNFLRRYQIVPMIASRKPGSGSFHDSMPPTPIHSLYISLKGALKVVTNLGLLREINRVCKPSVWSLTNWGVMMEMFMLDYSPCRLECNALVSDKICKHSKSLGIGGDPYRAPWVLLPNNGMIPIKLGLPMKYAVSNIKQLPRQPLNIIISYLIWVNKMDVVSPKCSIMDYGRKYSIFYLLSSNYMERKVPCGVFLVNKGF